MKKWGKKVKIEIFNKTPSLSHNWNSTHNQNNNSLSIWSRMLDSYICWFAQGDAMILWKENCLKAYNVAFLVTFYSKLCESCTDTKKDLQTVLGIFSSMLHTYGCVWVCWPLLESRFHRKQIWDRKMANNEGGRSARNGWKNAGSTKNGRKKWTVAWQPR